MSVDSPQSLHDTSCGGSLCFLEAVEISGAGRLGRHRLPRPVADDLHRNRLAKKKIGAHRLQVETVDEQYIRPQSPPEDPTDGESGASSPRKPPANSLDVFFFKQKTAYEIRR